MFPSNNHVKFDYIIIVCLSCKCSNKTQLYHISQAVVLLSLAWRLLTRLSCASSLFFSLASSSWSLLSQIFPRMFALHVEWHEDSVWSLLRDEPTRISRRFNSSKRSLTRSSFRLNFFFSSANQTQNEGNKTWNW